MSEGVKWWGGLGIIYLCAKLQISMTMSFSSLISCQASDAICEPFWRFFILFSSSTVCLALLFIMVCHGYGIIERFEVITALALNLISTDM